MICLSGNKQVRVYFYHDFTTTSTTKTPTTSTTKTPTTSTTKTPTYNDGFFVLQYYKSRFPHEGIHIVKIPVKPGAQYYNHLINSNIETTTGKIFIKIFIKSFS